jgi:hypothetical protein
VVTPLYLAETAPPTYKNRLGIANQSFISTGVLWTQALAIPLSKPYLWRFIPLVSAALALALLGTSLLVEESHVWLESQVKETQAESDVEEADPLLGTGKTLRNILLPCSYSTFLSDEARPSNKMINVWDLLQIKDIATRHARTSAPELCHLSDRDDILMCTHKIVYTVLIVQCSQQLCGISPGEYRPGRLPSPSGLTLQ